MRPPRGSPPARCAITALMRDAPRHPPAATPPASPRTGSRSRLRRRLPVPPRHCAAGPPRQTPAPPSARGCRARSAAAALARHPLSRAVSHAPGQLRRLVPRTPSGVLRPPAALPPLHPPFRHPPRVISCACRGGPLLGGLRISCAPSSCAPAAPPLPARPRPGRRPAAAPSPHAGRHAPLRSPRSQRLRLWSRPALRAVPPPPLRHSPPRLARQGTACRRTGDSMAPVGGALPLAASGGFAACRLRPGHVCLPAAARRGKPCPAIASIAAAGHGLPRRLLSARQRAPPPACAPSAPATLRVRSLRLVPWLPAPVPVGLARFSPASSPIGAPVRPSAAPSGLRPALPSHPAISAPIRP